MARIRLPHHIRRGTLPTDYAIEKVQDLRCGGDASGCPLPQRRGLCRACFFREFLTAIQSSNHHSSIWGLMIPYFDKAD